MAVIEATQANSNWQSAVRQTNPLISVFLRALLGKKEVLLFSASPRLGGENGVSGGRR